MDIIQFVTSNWIAAVAVVLVLGGLIFFHELGHFLAARAFKIGVVTFSLGFGKKLITIKRGKTEYCLSAFPLGGYVASVGEYSEEVEELGFTQSEALGNRPPWQRIVVAFAGPFANMLLAFILYWVIGLSVGLGLPLPQVGGVQEGSPAQMAGILPGDTVLALNSTPVDSWQQVPEGIAAAAGNPVTLLLQRGDEKITLTLTPERKTRTNLFGEEENAWLIGIQNSGAVRHVPLDMLSAAREGWNQTWDMMAITLKGLWKLITGSVSADNVGGPILIAQLVGQQAEQGLIPLLMLAALISVNLGLLNLMPVPILDGGLIVFCLIEMIIRRPLPKIAQERAMQVGAVMIIALMLFATYNDVVKLIFGS